MKKSVLVVLILMFSSLVYAECIDRPYEGFGATNGAEDCPTGYTVYTVTSLANAGVGTLKEALSEGCRYIDFDIEGTIVLTDPIYVTDSYITIDGSTAPGEGITLHSTSGTAAMSLETSSCHDVVVNNLRFRDSYYDALRIYNNAHHIVVDHCSFTGPNGDGNADTTEGAHDITFQWNILGVIDKNQLVRYNPKDITFHHNLYFNGLTRNPLLDGDPSGVFDFVNNVVFNWLSSGTAIDGYSNGNLIGNYWLPGPNTPASKNKRAILIGDGYGEGYYGLFYREGNIIPVENEVYLTGFNTNVRYDAPAVTTASAEYALVDVYHEAGACPRDNIDEAYVGTLLNYFYAGECVVGAEIIDTCMCWNEPYYSGYCCDEGWQEGNCSSIVLECYEDGTPYGECSETKPWYCNEGNFEPNCQECFCATGWRCTADGSCVEVKPRKITAMPLFSSGNLFDLIIDSVRKAFGNFF